MAVNPAGPIPLFDGEVPRTLTVRASVGTTGGQLIFFSGAANNISSGINSYATNDITIGGAASGALFNGIIITPGLTASGTNNYVTVAQNGTWIVSSAGTIVPGDAVLVNGADAVIGWQATGMVIAGSYTPIGRSISNAGSEGYAAVTFY